MDNQIIWVLHNRQDPPVRSGPQKYRLRRFIIIKCYTKCFFIDFSILYALRLLQKLPNCLTVIEIWGDESVIC